MADEMSGVTDPVSYETLILGLGNVLWADEGFGVRAAEALNAGYRFGSGVHLMDGGTQGIFLIPWVRSATRLLILDPVDYGLEPGTLKIVHGDDVPRFMGAKKVSMHQAGFQEVLMSAKLTGDFPDQIALVGVQPALLDDYGGSLTDRVKARVPDAVDAAIRVLEGWGIDFEARTEPLADAELIGPNALGIDDYETGRPG
jgi:hydrogenase maturation protease